MCGLDPVPALTPLPPNDQTPGDCQISVCDGLGAVVGAADDTDLPDDGNACTSDTCSDGDLNFVPLPSGTPCGSGVCDGNGTCVGCVQPSDCGSGTFCQGWSCDSGMCNPAPTLVGTALPQQTAHDCLVDECDGNGSVTQVADDTDTPLDDGNQCTAEACSNGAPQHPPEPADTPCNQSGIVCDGAGTCVACNIASHCGSVNGACEQATCVAHVCGTAPVDSGSCGNPSCFPYVCDGTSTGCPSTCTVSTECATGYACQGTSCLAIGTPWTVFYPDSEYLDTNIELTNVEVDYDGDVLIQGRVSNGGMTIAGTWLGALTEHSKWLVKLDGSTGQAVWATPAGFRVIPPIALDVDGANNIVSQYGWGNNIAQYFVGIEKYDPNGVSVMGKGFAGGIVVWSRGLAVDWAGNVFGRFDSWTDIVNYGGGPETGERFVGFDANLFFVFSTADTADRRIAGMSTGYALAGQLPMVGLDVGCGMMTPTGTSVFISRQSPSGACLWQKVIDGPQAIEVAVDGCDRIAVAFTATTTVDLGGGPLPPIGTSDLVVGVYDGSGAHQWSQRFASSVAQGVTLEAGINGHLLVANGGIVDFGTGPIAGQAVLDPQGAFVGTVQLNGALAMHPSGDVISAWAGAGIGAMRVSPQ